MQDLQKSCQKPKILGKNLKYKHFMVNLDDIFVRSYQDSFLTTLVRS